MAVLASTRANADSLTQQMFSHREMIPSRSDVLWLIESGAVRTKSWSEEGNLMTLGYWGPGDVVGRPLSRIVPYEIECVTKVEVSILSSALWQEALDAIILHTQQAEELLSIVHRNPASLRLWQFLLWLGEKFGRDVNKGRLIDLGVTHQEKRRCSKYDARHSDAAAKSSLSRMEGCDGTNGGSFFVGTSCGEGRVVTTAALKEAAWL